MTIRVHVDYTCPYTYRAHRWLELTEANLDWRPFSLLQANRGTDGSPVWGREEHRENISLLALAGHEEVRRVGCDLDAYRRTFFSAWHEGDERLSADDVVAFCEKGGLDREEIDLERGLRSVGEEHTRAARLGIFGSPTLVFPSGVARFVRISQVPSPERAEALLEAIEAFGAESPELHELKAIEASPEELRRELLEPEEDEEELSVAGCACCC